MTTHKDREVFVTGGAQDTIRRCLDQLDSIRYWHGIEEGDRAAATFGKCLGTLMLNAERIMWDGDLSLISQWRGGLVVGMNWHGESPASIIRRRHPDEADKHLEVLGDTIHEMPESGEWSLNS